MTRHRSIVAERGLTGVLTFAAVLFALITATDAVGQPPPRRDPPPRAHPDRPPPDAPAPSAPDELGPPDAGPAPEVDEIGQASASATTQRAGRPRRAEELATLLFRPRAQDLGPLQPGEEDALMNFARERTPRVFRALDWFRERRPMVFRQRLSGMAPRLRQLQRIYERNPALGDALRGHMESMFEIRRRLQVLGENEPGSALRERTIEELRDLVADSVAREHEALLLLADELDRRRPERAAAWVDYLTTTTDDDFPRIPEPVRELIRQYRAAGSDTERDAVRVELGRRVEKFVSNETDALRERAERRKAEAADEVDRRLKAFIEESERPGPPGPRPRRGPPRP